MMEASLQSLIERIGAEHVEQRLKTEREHEAQLFGQGTLFFNLENWYAAPFDHRHGAQARRSVCPCAQECRPRAGPAQHLYLAGICRESFDGFTILHISDLHADISVGAMRHLVGHRRRPRLRHLCSHRRLSRQDLRAVRQEPQPYRRPGARALRAPVYGVLGNHDYDPHDAGAGGDGHPHAVQRMRDDHARRRARSISPASTTRTFIAPTTSARPRRRSRAAHSRSCCRTRRRSTGRPRAPGSLSC